jgi:NhaP-type Na+/H+ or K+/H+ antiporter
VRKFLEFLFWAVVLLLALAFAFTIIGSAMNLNGVLNAGIVSWLAASFLFFVWLVLWIWSRTKRYKRQ